MTGRVPVRVVGGVNKGQKVYADGIGRASKSVAIASSASPVSELQIERAQVERFIGIALENNVAIQVIRGALPHRLGKGFFFEILTFHLTLSVTHISPADFVIEFDRGCN